MSGDFFTPPQSTAQFPDFIVAPQQIRPEELDEAVKESIQTPQLYCQCDQKIRDLIPEMVEAFHSRFAPEVRRYISDMLEAARSRYAREFRALVPEMVEEVLKKLDRNPSSLPFAHHAESSASRILQLHFNCVLPHDGLFTLTNIQNHEGASVKVELWDDSGSIVEDGPESSATIEISVLDGGLKFEDKDDWETSDLDKNIAQPREDKGPLLKGKLKVRMSKGVAIINNLTFTDNSKAMRNGKFRFRAQAVKKGLPSGVYARDAVSEPFRVKERRTRKHCRSLKDNTQCLKHIGQKLCQKLAGAQIHTLQDFLQKYHTDAKALQKILLLSENKWSELVKDAESLSFTDNKGYRYHDEDSGVDLVLDCVFNIVSALINGQLHQPSHLDDNQKEVVNRIRCIAYEKRSVLLSIDVRTSPIHLQAGSISPSRFPPANTQDLDTTAVHTAPTMTIPSVNRTIGRMCEDQDLINNLSPNQTIQDQLITQHHSPGYYSQAGQLLQPGSLVGNTGVEEALFCPSPGQTAEWYNMVYSYDNMPDPPYINISCSNGAVTDALLANQFNVASTSISKVQILRFRSVAYVARFKTAIKLSIKSRRRVVKRTRLA